MDSIVVQYLKSLKEDLSEFSELDVDTINVNSKSIFGDTPLHVAVVRNDYDMVKVLIENGANVNIRGDFGHTPLYEATLRKNFEIVKLLIDSGADLTIANEFGDRPDLRWFNQE